MGHRVPLHRHVGHGLAVCTLATLTLGIASPGDTERVAPFDAWVQEDRTRIHETGQRTSPIIGGLSRGDVARVVECSPSCTARSAMVRIEPFGYVRLADFGRGPRPETEAELRVDAPVRFVRAAAGGAITRASPSDEARPLGRHRTRDEIVLVGDARADVPGFLRRAGGGWVASRAVHPITPSAFAGTESPSLPLAFVIVDTPVSGQATHRRYERAPVTAEAEETVTTPRGMVPRAHVRVARLHPRPNTVGENERWVHVDISEQTLVAYEGERPYFATLVSTGTYSHPTKTGLFRVYQKTRVMEMNGAEEDARYRVEGVSSVLFFHNDLALHTAYWHDRFGTPVSHGCVNLSPADARRIFAWAPPEMPHGFRTVFPARLDLPALRVLVTR